ncbi:helix-turn-helix transcriptional regulator [Actinocrispum sp. NPDC049592]|uniref:helix-turn-helix domain-containing protein n=1 Tax=Actinocrispum sp. NPDC049592 TaxID=3154835 RepID=UPI0034167BE7
MSETADLLAEARRAAGISQDELARRAGTSRTTLSAYEHGRKSPTIDTASRLLGEIDLVLTYRHRIDAVEHVTPRGRPFTTLSHLPRLPLDVAFATVTLPPHLNWSDPDQRFDLADRGDRALVYEIVLSEGVADDIQTYVDGALLVDLWPDLVLPRGIREAWTPIIEADRAGPSHAGVASH